MVYGSNIRRLWAGLESPGLPWSKIDYEIEDEYDFSK
jgi:hypothetical protein